MSVPIVIDEWLLEDLAGVNGKERQGEAVYFLYKLEEICDRVVILEGSPFENKIWELMKMSNNGSPVLRVASQTFQGLIYTNLNKVCKLTQADISPLPAFLVPLINSPKDHYLFQAYRKLENKGCFILTSDGRWNHKRLTKSGIRIQMRDQFVPEYLNRQSP